ncbi:MAG: hypothetical protein ABI822_25025, partial [Bryobacteraceae bacterium]
MKICCLALFLSLLPAVAEEVKPETVVAVVNGKPYTAADIERLIAPLSPVRQQMVHRDPKAFLEEYAMFDLIADMAEKAKVYEKSPY